MRRTLAVYLGEKHLQACDLCYIIIDYYHVTTEVYGAISVDLG